MHGNMLVPDTKQAAYKLLISEQGSAVLDGLLHSYVGYCQSSASQIRYPPSAERTTTSLHGRRAFSVAGPRAWNLLPDHLRDPSLSFDSFRSALKTYLFTTHGTRSAVEVSCVMRFTNRQSSSSSSSSEYHFAGWSATSNKYNNEIITLPFNYHTIPYSFNKS